MLERKRVEENCVRMVRGALPSITPPRPFPLLHLSLSASLTPVFLACWINVSLTRLRSQRIGHQDIDCECGTRSRAASALARRCFLYLSCKCACASLFFVFMAVPSCRCFQIKDNRIQEFGWEIQELQEVRFSAPHFCQKRLQISAVFLLTRRVQVVAAKNNVISHLMETPVINFAIIS